MIWMVEQASQQKNWYKTFHNMLNNINYDLDCNYHAKVIKYDKTHHTADIQPLNNFSDGSKKAQILDVPVSKCCYEFDEWLAAVKGDFGKVDGYADDKGIQIASSFVSKIPTPIMHVGAVVVVTVMDHDMDDWDGTAKEYTPSSGRQHDINDSIIVGVI